MSMNDDDDTFILQPIKCEFKKIPCSGQEGNKSGRYSNSYHWDIPQFLEKRWVVLGYLDVDWVTLESQSKSQDEILLGCLMHLNKTPEKKKGAKKDPRPKFGKLEPYKAKFTKKDDKPVIICEFKTDERNNPNFWGEGPSWNGEKVSKRRGRPPKAKTDQTEQVDEQEKSLTE